ncbi:MAG TPA: 30S ribosomal protein THX [Luteimonas sp.]
MPSRASRSTFRKTRIQEHEMGKGDRKTAKGKRYNSSYGNARTHVATKATGAASAPVAKKAATRTTRAPAKKVVAKKTVVKE